MIDKTYSKLLAIPTFEERFAYLKLDGRVGEETFGRDRYLNQALYQSREWRNFRNFVIARDFGHDMAMEDPDYEITGSITVHHINPVTLEDIEERSSLVFNPNNVVCVSHATHEAIHYGDFSLIMRDPIERRPGDTLLWKKAF